MDKPRRRGQPPKPGGANISLAVRVPPRLLREIDRLAEDTERKRSQVVNSILEREIPRERSKVL